MTFDLTNILQGSILLNSMVFAEISAFTKTIFECLSSEEFRDLQNQLIRKPKSGKVIRGTGGARKIRYAQKGRGKRGGIRVIYYYSETIEKIWFLAVYEKSKKSDLTSDDEKYLKYIIETLKSEADNA